MKKTVAIIMTLSLGMLIGCTKSSDKEENICYSFDKRQCDTDPWVSDAAIDMPTKVRDYLQSKSITVKSISVNMNYHEAVCEACNICPVGPRIYVSINSEDEQKLKEEGFLDLAVDEECLANKE